jgi:hypothetical protein
MELGLLLYLLIIMFSLADRTFDISDFYYLVSVHGVNILTRLLVLMYMKNNGRL